MTVTLPNEVIILIMTAALAFSFYVFFWELPACLVSLFRYKMWTLRDNLWGDVASGKLPDNELTSNIIESADGVIANARHARVSTLIVAPDWRIDDETKERRKQLRLALTKEQQELLFHYEEGYANILVGHAAVASPSGWVVVGLALVLFMIHGLILSLRRGIVHPLAYAKGRLSGIFQQQLFSGPNHLAGC